MTETFRKPPGSQKFNGNAYKFSSRRPEKEILRKQGVLFDAEHESSTNIDGLTALDRSGDGHGTGLGSPSADECLTDEDSAFLQSVLYLDDMDSSSQDKQENFPYSSILSSRMKEQVQAKYREIMTDLSDVLENKDAEYNDEGSVVTEELEKEFTQKMQSAGVSKLTSKTNGRQPNAELFSDLESIKTEDYENRFQAVTNERVTSHALTAKNKLPVDSDGDTFCSLGTIENPTAKQRKERRSLSSGAAETNPNPVMQRDSQVTGNLKESQNFTDLDLDDDDEKVMELTSARARSELGNRKRNPAANRHLSTKKHSLTMLPVGSRKKPVTVKPATKLAILNKVDLEVSVKLQQELEKLQSEILSKIQMKQALAQTATRLHSLCAKRQQEVKLSEKLVKENTMKAENIRTELMLDEFKRNSVAVELQRLNAEIENRRLLLDELNHQETTSQKQLQRRTMAHREELEHSMRKAGDWLREKRQLEEEILFLKQRCLELETEKNDFIAEKTREYDAIKAEIQDQLRRNAQKSTKEMADVERVLHETSSRLQSAQTDATQKQQLNSQLMEQIVYLQQELEKQNQLRDQLLDENVRSLRTIIKEQETMLSTNQMKSRDEMDRAVQETRKEADQRLRQMERRYVEQLNDLNSQIKSKDADLEVLSVRVKEQDEWLADLMDRVKDETYRKFQAYLDEERDKWESGKKNEMSTQMETMKKEMTSKCRQLREELEHEKTLSDSYLQQLKDLKQELDNTRQRSHLIYQQKLEADRDLSSDTDLRQMERLKDEEEQTAVERLRETVDECREQLEQLEMEKKLLQAKQNAAEKAEKKFLEDLNQECRVISEILHKSKPDTTLTSLPSLKVNQADTRLAISTAMLKLKSSLAELGEKFSGQEREIENLKASVVRLNKQMRNKLLSLQEQFQKEKEQAFERLQDRLVYKKYTVETESEKAYGEDDLKKTLKEKDRQLHDIQHKWNAWKEQTTRTLFKKCREEVNKEMERRLVECQGVLGMTSAASELDTDFSESPINLKSAMNSTYSFSTQGREKSALTVAEQVPAVEAARSPMKGTVGQTQLPLVATVASIATADKHISRNLLTPSARDAIVPKTSAATISSCDTGGVAKNQLIVQQLQLQIDRVENSRKVAEGRANENEHLLNQKLVELAQLQTVLSHQNKELMQLQRSYSRLQKSNH